MKITAYIDYNEKNKVHYYKTFDVVEEIPKLGEEYGEIGIFENEKVIKVEPVKLDCEQGSDEVYFYDYFKITTEKRFSGDEEKEENFYYLAIENKAYFDDPEEEA